MGKEETIWSTVLCLLKLEHKKVEPIKSLRLELLMESEPLNPEKMLIERCLDSHVHEF
jgi:hypothetical protein